MSINKQSLPKRIISLLLAVAIMVGFVPIIDIDLTAFAATYDGIELNDTTSKSSDNWVWDNTTQTLSLYNAKFSNGATGSYAIKYTGTGTLKIDQIGYNLIENGYIQAENGSIEVIGTGILDINHYAEAMFNTKKLDIKNGYVRSDNATTLNKYDGNKTTVSNCVLDIPQAEIMAKAQTDGTAGFIMESGYVNCGKLTNKCNASNYLAAEIEGGYLDVKIIDGEINTLSPNFSYIKLGKAVVKAETLNANAVFTADTGASIVTNPKLNNSTLLLKDYSSNEHSDYFSNSSNVRATYDGYNAYYDDTLTDRATYYHAPASINDENDLTNAGTIVCNGGLALGVSAIPADTTIYGDNMAVSPGTINGCLIGNVISLSGSTVGSTGRIYGKTQLSLSTNATINASGAVTVYNNSVVSACQFNDKSLTVNGDFSVIKRDGSVFGNTEKNITVGATGQLAVVGNVNYSGGGFGSETVYNAITTGNDTSRTVYASKSYNNNAMNCQKYDNPSTAYIGEEFNKQLLALDSADIICEKAYGGSADLNFLCSHNIANLSDVSVTITTGGGGDDVTDKFNIRKSYSDTTGDDKTKITITLSLEEDIDARSYNVAVTVDGLTATTTLTAEYFSQTLDFTAAAGAWNFHGAFDGTDNESKATPDSNGDSIWAWYPSGAEGYTGKVLVLNKLAIKTTAVKAIVVPANTTIVVKGENKIQSRCTAIKCNGDATIVGDNPLTSQLTVKSDCSYPEYYAAIKADGWVTIKNFSNLVVEMGNANSFDWSTSTGGAVGDRTSYGIYGQRVEIANVSNGSITAGDADVSAAIVSRDNDIYILNNCSISLKAARYALNSNSNLSLSTPLTKLDNAYESDRTTAITKEWYNNEVITNPDRSPCLQIYTKDASTPTIVNTQSNLKNVLVCVNGLGNGTVSLDGNELTGFTPETYDPTSGYQRVSVNKYSSPKFTFTAANADCYISEIKYNGADITDKLFNIERNTESKITKADYRIDSIEEGNYNIEVTFVNGNIRPYTLTVNSPNGTVTLSPNAQLVSGNVYTYNSDQNITAAVNPDTGYKVTSVKLGSTTLTAVNGTYEIGRLSANSTLTVTYERLKYSVNLPTTIPNGTLSNDYSGSSLSEVPHGTQIEFTATPDNGYKLSSVKVNGRTIPTNGNTFTVTVTGATRIEVTFTENSGGGSYTPPPTTQLPALDGTGYSYARMAEVLATYKTGSTATIETNGNYNVPEAVIKAIANGKLKVTFVMNSTVSRYIDGADIETAKSVDADIRVTYSLDTDELSGDEAMQLILFKFDVPSDLIIDLNAKNAGLFANLYKYTNGKFEFAECAKIGKDGKAVFENYTISGTYAVMLSANSAKPGDVNNDGKLNAADAAAVLRYVVKLDGNYTNLSVADLDGNVKINARDALLILKRVVGLI